MALKNGVDFSSLSFGVSLKFEASSLTWVPALPPQWLAASTAMTVRHLSLQPGVQITRTDKYWQFGGFSSSLPSTCGMWISALFSLRGLNNNSVFQMLEGCLKHQDVHNFRLKAVLEGKALCWWEYTSTKPSHAQARNHQVPALGAGKRGFWSQFPVTTFLCNINAIQITHILQGTGSESHVVMSRPYAFFSKGTDIKLLWIKVLPPEPSLGLIFRSFQGTYGEPRCPPPFQRGSQQETDLHCLRRDISASPGGHRWALKKPQFS